MSPQNARILSHLKRGWWINPVQALDQYGSFRLSERIREIEAMGHEIQRDWHETTGGARVRKYRMVRK